MRNVSAAQLAAQLENESPMLLDVREPWEYEICHIEGSTNVPMHEVPQQLARLQTDGEIIVICHHGVRSQNVIRFLELQSVSNLVNLDGGVDAWAREVDPEMPLY